MESEKVCFPAPLDTCIPLTYHYTSVAEPQTDESDVLEDWE
ncbi:MAG TPA: hypothetical protein VEQ63_06540 [Bryobacteraceae bacterium]|nr:hypothetical protein [Bryobacteraceae bacterium]